MLTLHDDAGRAQARTPLFALADKGPSMGEATTVPIAWLYRRASSTNSVITRLSCSPRAVNDVRSASSPETRSLEAIGVPKGRDPSRLPTLPLPSPPPPAPFCSSASSILGRRGAAPQLYIHGYSIEKPSLIPQSWTSCECGLQCLGRGSGSGSGRTEGGGGDDAAPTRPRCGLELIVPSPLSAHPPSTVILGPLPNAS